MSKRMLKIEATVSLWSILKIDIPSLLPNCLQEKPVNKASLHTQGGCNTRVGTFGKHFTACLVHITTRLLLTFKPQTGFSKSRSVFSISSSTPASHSTCFVFWFCYFTENACSVITIALLLPNTVGLSSDCLLVKRLILSIFFQPHELHDMTLISVAF